MNRLEAITYLNNNPNAKLKAIKDRYGIEISKYNDIVSLDKDGYVRYRHLYMRVYVQNDKSEFEIYRKLKEFTFQEGIEYLFKFDLNIMTSIITNNIFRKDPYYFPLDNHNSLTLDEVCGMWTIDEVYNNL